MAKGIHIAVVFNPKGPYITKRLLTRIANGDAAAFNDYVYCYRKEILKCVSKLSAINDPSILAEVTDNIFQKIWENRKAFCSEAKPVDLLFNTMVREIIRYLKGTGDTFRLDRLKHILSNSNNFELFNW